jgi:hypothetical protein
MHYFRIFVKYSFFKCEINLMVNLFGISGYKCLIGLFVGIFFWLSTCDPPSVTLRRGFALEHSRLYLNSELECSCEKPTMGM